MNKGHAYILNTLKNLEDQLLADNYPVGKEIVKQIPKVRELVKGFYSLKDSMEECINAGCFIPNKALEDLNIIENSIPDQIYGKD